MPIPVKKLFRGLLSRRLDNVPSLRETYRIALNIANIPSRLPWAPADADARMENTMMIVVALIYSVVVRK